MFLFRLWRTNHVEQCYSCVGSDVGGRAGGDVVFGTATLYTASALVSTTLLVPSTPQNLTARGENQQVSLNWVASNATCAPLSAYEVFRATCSAECSSE